jgi:alpha-tubulin suppressor-like RCC1 family protein
VRGCVASVGVAVILLAAGCAAPPERAVIRASATSDPTRMPGPVRPVLRAASTAPVIQISAGEQHACALHADATVSCWGANATGQVADHPSARRTASSGWPASLPTPVRLPLDGVLEVRAGSDRTCVRRADGIWCMGAPAGEPVHIAGTAGAIDFTRDCARRAGGEVTCWGDLLVATPAPELAGAVSLAEARRVTCALMPGAVIRCWKLDGGDTEEYDAREVRRLVGRRADGAVQLGYSPYLACVRAPRGEVSCWSAPYSDYDETASPYTIAVGVTDAVELGVGLDFACARSRDRAVRCWGQLPWRDDGTTGVERIDGLVADELAVGGAFVCARTGGDVACWGSGAVGQLGNGWAAVHAEPIDVPGITDAVDVEVAQGRTCVRRRDGSVWCWGSDDLRATTDVTPREVPRLRGAVEISIERELCGRLADGDVWCGGVGGATLRRRARGAIGISVGGEHSSALRADGGLVSWGVNSFGQFFDGKTEWTETTGRSRGLADATAVVVRDYGSCVVRAGGTVWCAGRNPLDFQPQPTPAPVGGTARTISLAVAAMSACVVVDGGAVRCWGNGNLGTLGRDGEPATRAALPIEGLTDAVQVAGTRATFCARRRDGAVACWGDNATGLVAPLWHADWLAQPTVVLDDAVDIAVGTHACAVRTDGRVTCWGAAESGQLGTRTTRATRFGDGVKFGN